MIISKKRYNEAIAKAVDEVHKQIRLENELRELERLVFEELERLRNQVRRLEAMMYERTGKD